MSDKEEIREAIEWWLTIKNQNDKSKTSKEQNKKHSSDKE